MPGPLAGVRVLDLSRVLAGPWCTQALADLGADVVKVERPGRGDDTRQWGPPFLKTPDGRDTEESAYFLSCNRGKRSLTLDVSKPEGQRIVRELAKTADVFVENYKTGDMKRYGIDYAALAAINPRIVYCSITGFGQTGPYAERAGYDFMIQGMGGFMSVTGERDGLPGAGPQKAGVAVADLFTGMYASQAILAALFEQRASGRGQYVDLALLDAQVAMLQAHNYNYLVSGEVPKRWGNAHPNLAPYQAFPTKDGDAILATGNDSQFRKFCEVAGLVDMPNDPRFVDNRARLANRDALVARIAVAMRERTTAEWVSALEAVGVPCGPINRINEVFADPQVQARGTRFTLRHATGGEAPMVANPIKYSRTAIAYDRAPPMVGEHTDEILGRELGMSAADIARLRADRIV